MRVHLALLTCVAVAQQAEGDCGEGKTHSLWYVGVATSVIGSIVGNFGQNVQKLSQVKNSKRNEADQKGYTGQPLWWFGLFFVVFGSGGDFIGLIFAPAAVVMPVGTVSLVANIFFAHCWLGEHFNIRDMLGTFMIVLGATGVAIAYGFLGKSQCSKTYDVELLLSLLVQPTMVAYVLFVAAFLGYFNRIRTKAEACLQEDGTGTGDDYKQYQQLHPMSYAVIAGTLGGQSVMLAKAFVELLGTSLRGDNQFRNPCPYCIVLLGFCTAMYQTHFVAEGLHYFDALYIVPIFQCTFMISSIFGGAVYYQELSAFLPVQWVVFLGSVAVTVVGVVFLSMRDMSGEQELAQKTLSIDEVYGRGTQVATAITVNTLSEQVHRITTTLAHPVLVPEMERELLQHEKRVSLFENPMAVTRAARRTLAGDPSRAERFKNHPSRCSSVRRVTSHKLGLFPAHVASGLADFDAVDAFESTSLLHARVTGVVVRRQTASEAETLACSRGGHWTDQKQKQRRKEEGVQKEKRRATDAQALLREQWNPVSIAVNEASQVERRIMAIAGGKREAEEGDGAKDDDEGEESEEGKEVCSEAGAQADQLVAAELAITEESSRQARDSMQTYLSALDQQQNEQGRVASAEAEDSSEEDEQQMKGAAETKGEGEFTEENTPESTATCPPLT